MVFSTIPSWTVYPNAAKAGEYCLLVFVTLGLLALGIVLPTFLYGFQDDVLDGGIPGLEIHVSDDAFVLGL